MRAYRRINAGIIMLCLVTLSTMTATHASDSSVQDSQPSTIHNYAKCSPHGACYGEIKYPADKLNASCAKEFVKLAWDKHSKWIVISCIALGTEGRNHHWLINKSGNITHIIYGRITPVFGYYFAMAKNNTNETHPSPCPAMASKYLKQADYILSVRTPSSADDRPYCHTPIYVETTVSSIKFYNNNGIIKKSDAAFEIGGQPRASQKSDLNKIASKFRQMISSINKEKCNHPMR